jgi:two-component system chemotaxis response regulator CheY
MELVSRRHYDFSNLSVLLVDESRFSRTIVGGILRSFGFGRVHERDNAPDAFNLLQQASIDLIVTEWMLEPLDGRDFTRLVRTGRDSPTPMIPIIMLTGNTAERYVVEARDAGVTEFLGKPVTGASLMNRLIHVIDRPRPFVRSPNYVGPCRRRRDSDTYTGPERRRDGRVRPDLAADNITAGLEWNLDAVPANGPMFAKV